MNAVNSDETTLVEMAEEAGMTPAWIHEELVHSIAALGIMLLEEGIGVSGEESDADELLQHCRTMEDGYCVIFDLEDDYGEIEVIVRRVPPQDPPGIHTEIIRHTIKSSGLH